VTDNFSSWVYFIELVIVTEFRVSSDHQNHLDLKVCDDRTVVQILRFWTLSIVWPLSKTPFYLFIKTQRFRDWILSPSSGKTYSVGSNR
jgi:hypothetical protein